jgi:hypothetical protein
MRVAFCGGEPNQGQSALIAATLSSTKTAAPSGPTTNLSARNILIGRLRVEQTEANLVLGRKHDVSGRGSRHGSAECGGAICHAMARGNGRQQLFSEEDNYRRMTDGLEETVARTGGDSRAS